MDMDSATYAVNMECLSAEETDDSCTTECIGGACCDEVTQENLAVVKHEADDVCCVICVIYFISVKK